MRQRYKGEDIRARLHHTIIRYKGVPYLAEVMPEGIIAMRNVVTGNLDHNVDAEDSMIDISSITIGYVNVNDADNRCAVHLKRDPLRRFKQGIEIDYLKQNVLRKGGSQINRNNILMFGFVDAVAGKFPSYQEALRMMTKANWQSVALSKDIALQKDADLYKVFVGDQEVAYIKAGTHKVNVIKNDVSFCYSHILSVIQGWEIVEGK